MYTKPLLEQSFPALDSTRLHSTLALEGVVPVSMEPITSNSRRCWTLVFLQRCECWTWAVEQHSLTNSSKLHESSDSSPPANISLPLVPCMLIFLHGEKRNYSRLHLFVPNSFYIARSTTLYHRLVQQVASPLQCQDYRYTSYIRLSVRLCRFSRGSFTQVVMLLAIHLQVHL